MAHEFELRTVITAPVAQCFDWSRNIDVHVDSMRASSERAIGGVTKGYISLGEEVAWRAIHFGVPLTLRTRITSMVVPHSFTDEQVSGPFKFFRHEHEFRSVGGGTLMIDRVAYAAPLGLLGRVAELAFLNAYMRKLIRRRNRFLVSQAAGSGAAGAA